MRSRPEAPSVYIYWQWSLVIMHDMAGRRRKKREREKEEDDESEDDKEDQANEEQKCEEE